MADPDPIDTPAMIALSIVVKEFLEVLPKTRARRFLKAMTFTMSGRDGWDRVVLLRRGSGGNDPAAIVADWWERMAPIYRRLLKSAR